MSDERRILTLGGHDFTHGAADEAINDYIVSLTGLPAPRVCLIPTASGDAGAQIARFHRAFGDRGADASVVALFNLVERPLALSEHLLSQDAIYVAGGSMLNMLAIWRVHRIEAILRQAWERGILLCGHSAGAMCWFELGITKSSGAPGRAEGFGLLPGSCCVHYHSHPDRRAFYRAAVQGALPDGFGIDDDAGILWHGDDIGELVSGRPGAGVTRVERREGVSAATAAESPLEVRELEIEAPSVPAEIEEFRRQHRLLRSAPGAS